MCLVGNMSHCVCPGFADTGPNPPRDALQHVLGSPSGHAAMDAAVLAHLSSVRSRLLGMRYRRNFHYGGFWR